MITPYTLQLAHGADPTLKNQEGQTPLDLCSADDVKCLLQDAMPAPLTLPVTNKAVDPSLAALPPHPVAVGAAVAPAAVRVLAPDPASVGVTTAPPDTVILPSGSTLSVVPAGATPLPTDVTTPAGPMVSVAAAGAAGSGGIGVGFPMPHPGDGSMDFTKTDMVTPETSLNMSMGAFLASLGLEQLREIFDREQISVDILAEMGHEDLKQIGITAFGHRHKLIEGLEKLLSGNGKSSTISCHNVAVTCHICLHHV